MLDKFKNLDDALEKLKEYLPNIEDKKNSVIFGISDNKGFLSSCLAHKIHMHLKVEFDFLFVKKIYSPLNDNLTVAMISETGYIATHNKLIDYLKIEKDYIHSEAKREYESIASSSHILKENDLEQKIKNKNIYLVDYAICSGLKMTCAIESIIEKKAKSIHIISPIIPSSIFDNLYAMVDNIYYVHKVDHFIAKKFYYKDLEDTTLENIAHLKNTTKKFIKQKGNKIEPRIYI